MMIAKYYGLELYHHGIKGQKWGIRKYQNEDGTWTEAGKIRYGVDDSGKMSKKGAKQYKKDTKKQKLITAQEEKVSTNQKYYDSDKKDYEEVKKNGIKSKYIKDLYGEDEVDYAKTDKEYAEWLVSAALDSLSEGIDEDDWSVKAGKQEIERLDKAFFS